MAEAVRTHSAAERGRAGLRLGVLAYRWAAFAWMLVLALTSHHFRYPTVAWTAIAVAGAWTLWLSVTWNRQSTAVRWIDLALSIALILLSGYVVRTGEVVGDHPFFAASYPVSGVMAFGEATGPVGGLLAGLALSISLALSRPLNGVAFPDLTASQIQAMVNGFVYYLSAGGAVGLVSMILKRSAAETQEATAQAIKERERAARLSEREALARQIHDSVLQALAMVGKRARELEACESVPGRELGDLAAMAGDQERALRMLVQREPLEPPSGKASLRDALEGVGSGADRAAPSVTCIGPIWLPAAAVDELSAAVGQALENVALHAHASKASVFADEDGGEVVVWVRDDGCGFVYEEERLRREGKMGILKSMKGRIEDLGGAMRITTAPGAGTEVEFRVPLRSEAPE
jgi:signal transduction histidine kinase